MKRSIDSAGLSARQQGASDQAARLTTSALRPAPRADHAAAPVLVPRHKPSGMHLIERPASELVDAHGQPVSVVQELSHRAQPKLAAEPQARLERTPHSARYVSKRAALLVSAMLVGAHFASAAPWAHVLLALSPLTLLLPSVRRGVLLAERAQWTLYAGLLWLALAWAELVQPSTMGGSLELQRLAALFALAVIMLRMQSVYGSMHEQGRRDPLTGLLNRRGLDELGTAELRRAARYNRPLAFALFDVDRFKHVNDVYGHAAGDRVLKLVSEQLMQLRTSDLAVRLGGDEFGLLMPETDLAGAELLVVRLQQQIQERMSEHGFPVTISVGIALGPDGRNMEALIGEADRMMYAAKSAVSRD